MKKVLMPFVILLTVLSMLLVGCGGTPTPPVKSTNNLNKLVTDGQTVEQVYALMSDSLKSTSVLYQATKIEESTSGWGIVSKDGGFSAGETGAFQVLYFKPAKATAQSFAVFFKANAVIGKAWFSAQNSSFIENILQGKSFQSTTVTPTTTTTN
jgi:hypothetical protein